MHEPDTGILRSDNIWPRSLGVWPTVHKSLTCPPVTRPRA